METSQAVQTKADINPGSVFLGEVRNKIKPCIQCGTCTASCPNAFAMDFTPRHMWRLVLMGQEEAVFDSKTFTLCSACYTCTLRCPRGLPLTEAIGNLKQIAAGRDLPKHKGSIHFYKSFMDSVRRHGRVDEMEFMSFYFMKMKNPMLPLRFGGLGMRLMGKGKISPGLPSFAKGGGPLEPIFKKVEEMEAEK